MNGVDPERSTLSNWQPSRDHRRGVRAVGGPVAYTTLSRTGCTLHLPTELLTAGAGTFTRDEYDLWEQAS